MDDEHYQLTLPPSFQQLYVPPGRIKPTIAREAMMARYELCEDLATQTTEVARTIHFSHGISEDEVLHRVREGLMTEPSVVTPEEAGWVASRTAELLDWPLPSFDAPKDQTP